MSYIDICLGQLPIDEGKRNKPYKDSVGILTIGVGRNLDDVGLRDDEIALMLRNDVAQADKDARWLVPSFDSLSDARKAVLVNMVFNLGRPRLGAFVRFLRAVADQQWDEASSEMLQSKWAMQVGQRAQRLAKMMREG
jgi:lysozyme